LAKNEQDVQNALLAKAENDLGLAQLLDVVCGVLGLRFHRQFVLAPLLQTPMITGGAMPLTSFAGEGLELLQPLTVRSGLAPRVSALLSGLESAGSRVIRKASSTLFWLMRAWQTRDPISAFMFFFVALESLLDSVTLEEGEQGEGSVLFSRLQNIVARSDLEKAEQASILESLKRMKPRFNPSFAERFRRLAMTSKIAGWQTDVAAVRQFNRRRNQLLHAGENQVLVRTEIEDEVRTLEDIVERYTAWVFLGSSDVYPSRWRPDRERGQEAP